MALSCFSECGMYQHLNSEMINGFHQTETSLTGDFPCFCDSCGSLSTLLDGFYEAEEHPHYEETNSQLLPCFLPQDYSLEMEALLHSHEFDFCHYPKRARTSNYHDFCGEDLHFDVPFDGSAALNICQSSEFSTGFPFSPPELQLPVSFPAVVNEAEKRTQEGCPSVQSMAARQRRKKISEKTQELAKLIPGGGKMNTAEMFQAACKYVKFMQAQVGLLQFWKSIQETDQECSSGNLEALHVLLCSTKIQEKLYEEGKCMVPKELVTNVAETQHLRSNPSISKDLERLLQC